MPKKPRDLPRLSLLQETFFYDQERGLLLNRVARTTRRLGERADRRRSDGYGSVEVQKRRYMAHRIIWLMEYGRAPTGFIDHINGDKSDNRISNLRESTHPANMVNRPTPPHNTSGAKGVHFRKDNGMWRAYISWDRKRTHLGQFVTFDEAKDAVDAARAKLHGQFANFA